MQVEVVATPGLKKQEDSISATGEEGHGTKVLIGLQEARSFFLVLFCTHLDRVAEHVT